MAKAHLQGVVPPGVDTPEMYRIRSGEVIMPRNVDWWDGAKDLREHFSAQALEALTGAVEVPAVGG